MEEHRHRPAPEDLKAWWPENGSAPGPPANPWLALSPPAHVHDPRDWPAVHSQVSSIVRMSETVVDTLACQLRQDEQAARLFAKHLANVDAHLRSLSQHLHASVPDNVEPSSALPAVEGYDDAVRELEAGLQSVFTELQRMQASQAAPGLSAALAEHAATLRALQGTLTAALTAVDELATACTAAQPR